ncbi:polyprenyl synthetase family protein [Nocardioides hwasunensis]|uniref:Polyprenyl synthetase family protein n=1 Tax=Nocardioides hwasunensis TaxID=397258 RepID=A0ABR8MDC1_9ACTN|nr:polyprenyl synthetase family protein [Nocardioides hwasunensis]MBD3913525.1 polyprenyl synthetase family protein [Nocardioides hwasunensis]
MSATATDAALLRLLEEGRTRAAAIDPDHAVLWDALCAATEGGKRFRPALVVTTHDALGGTSPDAAAVVGAAVELLHTAFVIHDDVIDGDDVRRGRPNVSGTFGDRARAADADSREASDYGRTAAILAGDLALSTAVRAVATSGPPPDVVRRLLDLFDEALHTTAAGELADVRLSLDLAPVSLEESLAMAEQKTSAYSFSLPLRAGAVLAGADERTTDLLAEAGRALGVAFQLTDDLVGVFGDPRESGKSTTSDLRSRKQTPLLVHARSTAAWERIRRHVGRDLDDAELREVRELLTESGSRHFVEGLAEQRLAAAHEITDELGISLDLLTSTIIAPRVAGGRELVA